MVRRLSALNAGDGVSEAFRCWSEPPANGIGCVLGVFSTGFYVGAGSAIFAVGGPEIPCGPIHLVLESSPPLPREGSRVQLAAGELRTAWCSIALATAARYRPARPTAAQLLAVAPVLAGPYWTDAVPADLVHLWPDVEHAVARADLDLARSLLQGVGGGLTPTGDDVLAALLLFAQWADPASTLPAEVAARAATTDLSRGFLRWAAAGQSIQPVHALIDAALGLATADSEADRVTERKRFERSAAQVASIGGSSGRAMLAGLGLAAIALQSGTLQSSTLPSRPWQ